MKTTAVRLYGACDMRLESFELPQIGEREVLLRVVSDSLCASILFLFYIFILRSPPVLLPALKR